ncbi:hypothetical protein ADUPG1_011138 [Aduncisulcus paluster]|uniref:Aspartic peptidase DDI1-type domain-containing protein n=1 Tax=Aduncisulcus paluster TaxID=2918883 RepID=A0ABQ5JUG7_9EUKA|nr:hypothetical protein ADUPG1_011138 [Aduncisulcus paluster]
MVQVIIERAEGLSPATFEFKLGESITLERLYDILISTTDDPNIAITTESGVILLASDTPLGHFGKDIVKFKILETHKSPIDIDLPLKTQSTVDNTPSMDSRHSPSTQLISGLDRSSFGQSTHPLTDGSSPGSPAPQGSSPAVASQGQPFTIRIPGIPTGITISSQTISQMDSLARRGRVQQNLEYALTHYPEHFGSVEMLYIKLSIHGVEFVALVDSGAQISIISQETAVKAKIDDIIDTRMRHLARGVGEQMTLGRIHVVDVKCDSLVLPCAFTVLERSNIDAIFGLDMLKRHQIILDMQKKGMIVHDKFIPFLGPSEIPSRYRE